MDKTLEADELAAIFTNIPPEEEWWAEEAEDASHLSAKGIDEMLEALAEDTAKECEATSALPQYVSYKEVDELDNYIKEKKKEGKLFYSRYKNKPLYFTDKKKLMGVLASAADDCFTVSLVKIYLDEKEIKLWKLLFLPPCVEELKLR